MWWCKSIIQPLREWRQEHQEFRVTLGYLRKFKPSLGYIDPYLKTKQNKRQSKQTLTIAVWVAGWMKFWLEIRIDFPTIFEMVQSKHLPHCITCLCNVASWTLMIMSIKSKHWSAEKHWGCCTSHRVCYSGFNSLDKTKKQSNSSMKICFHL